MGVFYTFYTAILRKIYFPILSFRENLLWEMTENFTSSKNHNNQSWSFIGFIFVRLWKAFISNKQNKNISFEDGKVAEKHLYVWKTYSVLVN